MLRPKTLDNEKINLDDSDETESVTDDDGESSTDLLSTPSDFEDEVQSKKENKAENNFICINYDDILEIFSGKKDDRSSRDKISISLNVPKSLNLSV